VRIIVMHIRTQTKDESDGTKERFNEEQGRLFDQFPANNIKYLLECSMIKQVGKIK
jgi:hypothetical protein